MATPIEVVVIDACEIARVGYRHAIEADPRMTYEGGTASLGDAHWCLGKNPTDVVIVEPEGLGPRWADFVMWAKDIDQPPTVIVVTAVVHPTRAVIARRVGADAFYDKALSVDALLDDIVDHHHGVPFDWASLIRMDRTLLPEDAVRLERLTPRERDVLREIGHGKINREIAADFDLTEKTVKNYVSHLLQKLDMHSRAEAAALAGRIEFFVEAPEVKQPGAVTTIERPADGACERISG